MRMVEELREEYREAFERWATQVMLLRAIERFPEYTTLAADAHGRVEAAQTQYRSTRDRLAATMLAKAGTF